MTHAAAARIPITGSLTASSAYAPVILVFVGLVLLAASAKLQIPLWPVPMTMQTYVILVIAMAYGTRLGVATVLAYLLAGALGLPVFAGTPEKGIGLAYMLGPTGGYLGGFVLSTYVMGKLAERGWDRRALSCLAAITVGHIVILACGVTWLAVSLGWLKALAVGLAPFILATVIKTILAGITLPLAWRMVERTRQCDRCR
jgi:biotin transport system substrate-specific component